MSTEVSIRQNLSVMRIWVRLRLLSLVRPPPHLNLQGIGHPTCQKGPDLILQVGNKAPQTELLHKPQVRSSIILLVASIHCLSTVRRGPGRAIFSGPLESLYTAGYPIEMCGWLRPKHSLNIFPMGGMIYSSMRVHC